MVIHYTSEFHDGFLIVDGTLAYHIGASIKVPDRFVEKYEKKLKRKLDLSHL